MDATSAKIESYRPERHDWNQIKRVFSHRSEEALLPYQRQERALAVSLYEEIVIGCVGFDVTTGEIYHIAVEPVYRGHHVARHLIEYLTSCVHSPVLKVTISCANAPFFEACGFFQEGKEGECLRYFRINRRKRCC